MENPVSIPNSTFPAADTTTKIQTQTIPISTVSHATLLVIPLVLWRWTQWHKCVWHLMPWTIESMPVPIPIGHFESIWTFHQVDLDYIDDCWLGTNSLLRRLLVGLSPVAMIGMRWCTLVSGMRMLQHCFVGWMFGVV